MEGALTLMLLIWGMLDKSLILSNSVEKIRKEVVNEHLLHKI
jgi:hypothetical protein